MIQEENLKGSRRVGGGGFPYDVRRTAYINVVFYSIFSRNWTLEKSDDSKRGAIKSLQEI